MREGEKAAVQEQNHVVYSGAVLIPFCVGSVTLPLSHCRTTPSSTPATCTPPLTTSSFTAKIRGDARRSKRRQTGNKQQPVKRERGDGGDAYDYNAGISRCTHVRYSYLRDGASAPQDLAYRHSWFLNPAETPLRHDAQKDGGAVTSASQLYAVVDRVVFKLPSSFPEPHRELTQPPFFVVDDTWAEHMVEMEVHFRPWLGIAPFTVSHMVPLQRRADLTPHLLSSTFGQSRPPPTVILASSAATQSPSKSRDARKKATLSSKGVEKGGGGGGNGDDNNNNNIVSNYGRCIEAVVEGITATRDTCIHLEDMEEAPIVAERRDAIRIFHPTLRVVRYLAAVRAMPSPPPEVPPPFCVFPCRGSASMQVRVEEREGISSDYRNQSNERRQQVNGGGGDNHALAHYREDTLPVWCFPFECIMHAHEPKRQEGAVVAMRAVLDALRKEQAELRGCIEQKIHSAMVNAEELRGTLQRIRDTCVLLQKAEKH